METRFRICATILSFAVLVAGAAPRTLGQTQATASRIQVLSPLPLTETSDPQITTAMLSLGVPPVRHFLNHVAQKLPLPQVGEPNGMMTNNAAGALNFSLVWGAQPSKTNFLASEPKGWVDIMPHESLKGWTRLTVPPGKVLDPIDQWSVDPAHGTIVCQGNHGHEWLRWDRELANFMLHVEWRFEKVEGAQGYNSGVFIRNDLTGRVWHQAQVGPNAYIFGQTLIHGKLSPIKTPPPATNPLHPIGDWNTYEIRCDGPKITLWVDGDWVGEVATPEVLKGYWGLEAEGYRIEFRNIKLKVLP